MGSSGPIFVFGKNDVLAIPTDRSQGPDFTAVKHEPCIIVGVSPVEDTPDRWSNSQKESVFIPETRHAPRRPDHKCSSYVVMFREARAL